MQYEVFKTPRGVFINRIGDDGITVGFLVGSDEKLLAEFQEWNSKQERQIDISEQPPEPTPQERRKAEYEKQGVTIEALTVALWEKMVEGRSAAADELQRKRDAIKEQFPAQAAIVKG